MDLGTAELAEFLAARYAEDWSEARDRELAAGLDDSRATRDVDAKREIVATLTGRVKADDSEQATWHQVGYDRAAFDVLRLMAQPYFDHPGYDPRWTPALTRD